MRDTDSLKFRPTSRIDKRRAETDRTFAEMKEKERKARLEKTERLRRLRMTSNKHDGQSH
jgi:hypothetical protein